MLEKIELCLLHENLKSKPNIDVLSPKYVI